MFFIYLASLQMAVFGAFFVLERWLPSHSRPVQKGFSTLWGAVCIFAMIWAQCVFYVWTGTTGMGPTLASNPLLEGGLFYLVYSLANYWAHRVKHSWYPAWKYLHTLHHAPSHMDSRIAFYRHPVEMIANTLLLLILGKVVLNVSAEAAGMALVIEGCLECFHHANIRLPSWSRKLGYLIQTPEMHLVHHKLGLHRYNYSPLSAWDTLFGTAKVPSNDDFRLGFKDQGRAWPYLSFKK